MRGISTARAIAASAAVVFSLTVASPAGDPALEAADVSEARWIGPHGPLPFERHSEVLEFLREARVTRVKKIGEGVNGAKKVTLELDGIEAHACFRTVDESKRRVRLKDGEVITFYRDSAFFEVAAYRLSRMLGMDSIPPTVKRALFGRKGTLQLWVENGMTEKKRRSQDIEPVRPLEFIRQFQDLKVFDNLVYNWDRNLGNILIDPNWKVWMIDHTRTFRHLPELRRPQDLDGIRRSLWERLESLDEKKLKSRLSTFLHPREMRGLLKRRDLLVQHIKAMIDAKGEHRVLFSY